MFSHRAAPLSSGRMGPRCFFPPAFPHHTRTRLSPSPQGDPLLRLWGGSPLIPPPLLGQTGRQWPPATSGRALARLGRRRGRGPVPARRRPARGRAALLVAGRPRRLPQERERRWTSTSDRSPAALLFVQPPPRPGTHPHDVYPAVDGGVWYTGQRVDARLPRPGDRRDRRDPARRRRGAARRHRRARRRAVDHRRRPERDRPRRSRPARSTWPLPADRPDANLNTATFDGDGILWFTGQNGIYGSLDPATGEMQVYDDPDGRGPYGIATTPDGDVWYSSLAGSHLGAIDRARARSRWSSRRRRRRRAAGLVRLAGAGSGSASGTPARSRSTTRPTARGGSGRCPARPDDLRGLRRRERHRLADRLRGERDRPVRPGDRAVRVDPARAPGRRVRQLAGRPGEIWGAESGVDKLVVVTGG